MVTAAPSACAASIVHDFTDSPSTSTVHAPQLDVSHPTLVPVSPHASRRYCTSSVRARRRGLRPTVHRHRDLHGRDLPLPASGIAWRVRYSRRGSGSAFGFLKIAFTVPS